MRLAIVPPVLALALALLVAACCVYLHAEPVIVRPALCQYGGGGMYNPLWWGACPTSTRGPVVFSLTLGAPNPTATPWPAQ